MILTILCSCICSSCVLRRSLVQQQSMLEQNSVCQSNPIRENMNISTCAGFEKSEFDIIVNKVLHVEWLSYTWIPFSNNFQQKFWFESLNTVLYWIFLKQASSTVWHCFLSCFKVLCVIICVLIRSDRVEWVHTEAGCHVKQAVWSWWEDR